MVAVTIDVIETEELFSELFWLFVDDAVLTVHNLLLLLI